ncbi:MULTISPECIES: hypothetical protein [Halostella]|uniref:hypothetical protein n=1 Tax=Halostella TaxID=1843185 RepID=UPI0019668A03|nr:MULTISPECIES: hypothetical protein [Halostella]
MNVLLGRSRSAAASVVEAVGGNERRRIIASLAVPLLFWLAVERAANLGALPLVAAAGLAAFLYTRTTARATLAAAAYGTGLLLVGVFLLPCSRCT